MNDSASQFGAGLTAGEVGANVKKHCMQKFAHLLRTHRVLNFFASVRLAVPLMVVLCATVAVGTILESLYNSDYAKLALYQTWWFQGLLALLWINICLSTFSRWPYQRRHAGFVITHIGLMTLLIGAMMTRVWGVDGSLSLAEGETGSMVVLPETVIGYQFEDSPRPQSIEVPRSLAAFEGSRESGLNEPIRHLFWVKRYLPFVTSAQKVVAEKTADGKLENQSVAVSFKLKSRFFEVSEWLHSREHSSMQMGPANVVLKAARYTGGPASAAEPSEGKRRPQSVAKSKVKAKAPSGAGKLKILDKKSGKVLAEHALGALPVTVAGVRFELVRAYRFASVSSNKLTEGSGPEPNPALELKVSKNGESRREVAFAKFPNFSMSKEGLFGLSTVYEAGGEPVEAKEPVQASDLPPGHPSVQETETPPGTPPPMGSGRNVIEFWADPAAEGESVDLVLKKDGKTVAHAKLNAGETYTTPWMGMTVTVASVVKGGRLRDDVVPVEPQKGQPLPPGAVEVQLADGSDSFWLIEGSAHTVELIGRRAQIFFGRRTLDLPFTLRLKKFTKMDYPGTETAMSFESLVEQTDTGATQLISMNEPLKRDGFTLYQSSYSLQQGRPPESIFSVNRDPGRPVKYGGSLILALGIIWFTLANSRWGKSRARKGQHS